MPVRAIIFDLDGTLVDSLGDIAGALDSAFVDHGIVAPTAEQVRAWIGGGASDLVARAVANVAASRVELARGSAPIQTTAAQSSLAESVPSLALRRKT